MRFLNTKTIKLDNHNLASLVCFLVTTYNNLILIPINILQVLISGPFYSNAKKLESGNSNKMSSNLSQSVAVFLSHNKPLSPVRIEVAEDR